MTKHHQTLHRIKHTSSFSEREDFILENTLSASLSAIRVHYNEQSLRQACDNVAGGIPKGPWVGKTSILIQLLIYYASLKESEKLELVLPTN